MHEGIAGIVTCVEDAEEVPDRGGLKVGEVEGDGVAGTPLGRPLDQLPDEGAAPGKDHLRKKGECQSDFRFKPTRRSATVLFSRRLFLTQSLAYY